MIMPCNRGIGFRVYYFVGVNQSSSNAELSQYPLKTCRLTVTSVLTNTKITKTMKIIRISRPGPLEMSTTSIRVIQKKGYAGVSTKAVYRWSGA